MNEKELFYREERLVPRESILVERKTPEKVFTDPFILTCLIIQAIMIIIVVALNFD